MTKTILIAAMLAVLAGPAAAQKIVNCWPETYWCTDQFGNKRLCVRRVCEQ